VHVHTSHQSYRCPPFTLRPWQWTQMHYDVVHNTFVAIAQDVNFYMGWKQLHTLPLTTFHFSHWGVDIVITKDGIRTLANIVIANPTWMDLLTWSYTTRGFTTSKGSQTKERNYCNWHPTNHFLPLAIEVFGCLDKQADIFLHDCANAMWNFKRLEGPPFFLSWLLLSVKQSQLHYKGCKHPSS
jgi:hypothetical protein